MTVNEIVRAGRADKVFNIGDQFTVMKGTTPLVFDVIGIDHDIPYDISELHTERETIREKIRQR